MISHREIREEAYQSRLDQARGSLLVDSEGTSLLRLLGCLDFGKVLLDALELSEYCVVLGICPFKLERSWEKNLLSVWKENEWQ